MLRRTKFNVSIDVWSKMSSNRMKSGTSRRYENFKYITRSDNTNDINKYTKKEHCLDNLHSMNEHMIVYIMEYNEYIIRKTVYIYLDLDYKTPTR